MINVLYVALSADRIIIVQEKFTFIALGNKVFFLFSPVIRARILQSTFDNRTQERRYLVRVITLFRSLVDLKTRQEIFVQDDYCQCPRLFLRKQYVIMGTAEQISVSELRLFIPQRPFVRIWQTNMKARLKSIGDICDDWMKNAIYL